MLVTFWLFIAFFTDISLNFPLLVLGISGACIINLGTWLEVVFFLMCLLYFLIKFESNNLSLDNLTNKMILWSFFCSCETTRLSNISSNCWICRYISLVPIRIPLGFRVVSYRPYIFMPKLFVCSAKSPWCQIFSYLE